MAITLCCRVARAVVADGDGKPAVTDFKVLATSSVNFEHYEISPCSEEKIGNGDIPESCSLIQCEPQTGRTHQIRVHCQFSGQAIAGDPKYGDAVFNQNMRELGLKRLFLHANSLAFIHPISGERLSVDAPLATDLKNLLDKLK